MSVVPEDARRFRLGSEGRLTLSRTTARRLRADRMARWAVSAGGLVIIASILGILIFILLEVWPLLSGASVRVAGTVPLSGPPLLGMLTDEHRVFVAAVDASGRLEVIRAADGARVLDQPLLGGAGDGQAPSPSGAPDPAAAASPGSEGPAEVLEVLVDPVEDLISISTTDGRVIVGRVRWNVTYDAQDRVTTPTLVPVASTPLDPAGRPVSVHAVGARGDGVVIAGQREDGALIVLRRETSENLLTGETEERVERSETDVDLALTRIVVSPDGRRLYAGTAGGELLVWPISGAELGTPERADAGGSAITAMALLIGGQALVVGQEDGSLSVWFRTPLEEGGFAITRVRDFSGHDAAIHRIVPSQRDKGFLVLDAAARLGLHYSTSHRTLWTGESPVEDPRALAYAPKADGAFLAGGGRLAALSIDNPHPQVSLRALFGRVWYEGYSAPEYVWQSSGATDAFEPKLSLTPLLIGTLKGTFYSLILAIPLAVLGAMYAAHFMHPALKRYVKPTIEVMAALPTVVLGFLAGLWLAPRLEQVFPAFLLMFLVLPVVILLAGWLVREVKSRFAPHLPFGTEVIPFMVALGLGFWLCIELSPGFGALLFGGGFDEWLAEKTGLVYDQRNAIVVGLAMGFAVIPIIFSISEDAFSNVPQNLVSGSLALGASRWQTVTRVVLPTASPGIFSAVMIGFGRAVGETMIVLMATGNTPIMDWNPFNGFRTLSANIAVEIPEAPQGDTLYRTLFLAALLLFVLTFIVNTGAELVRQRMRRRYAQL